MQYITFLNKLKEKIKRNISFAKIINFIKNCFQKTLKIKTKINNSIKINNYINLQKIKNTLISRFNQTKNSLNQKDNKNIILEIAVFACIFMTSLIINNTIQSYSKLLFELIVVTLAYFSAYYFLPKREFEFKTTLIFLLSSVILTPLLFLTYEIETSIDLLKSLFSLSIFVGLAFRIDISQKRKINTLIFSEKIINQNEIKNIKNNYNVIGIVHFDKILYEDFRNFHDIKTVNKYINIFKIIPIFLLPTRIVYIPDDNKNNIEQLIILANNLKLPIYKINGEIISNIDDLLPEIKLPKITSFSQKNIYINFNGNTVILELIKFISQLSNTILTVVCQHEILAKTIYKILKNDHNCSIKIGDINDFLSLENIDIVISPLPYNDETLAAEMLKDSVKNNLIYTNNMIKNCIKSNIKNIFVISTLNSLKAENWIGISQRLAELYTQNLDFQNKSDIKIIPIRLPETDYFNFSTQIPIANKFICSSILLKLIDDLLNNITIKGRVYSIIPKAVINQEHIYEIIKTLGMTNPKFITINDKSVNSFPPLNEHIEPYNISDVYFTNFVNKNKYDLSELKIIENSKSFRDLTDSILNSVYEKIK